MPTGVIAPKFNTTKGWGFVKPDGGGPDVLLHVNELADGEDTDWLRSGTRVAYDEISGRRGMRAVNVRVLTDEPEPVSLAVAMRMCSPLSSSGMR